jgi:hypothetical protein
VAQKYTSFLFLQTVFQYFLGSVAAGNGNKQKELAKSQPFDSLDRLNNLVLVKADNNVSFHFHD